MALGPTRWRLWHPTALSGTIGAAVASTLAQDTGPTEVMDTIGHAASVAGGLSGSAIQQSETAPFHRSHAASTAVRAVEAVAQGLHGTRGALDSGGVSDGAEGAAPRGLLGPVSEWVISEPWLRNFASSAYCYSPVDTTAIMDPIDVRSAPGVSVAVPATVGAGVS